jgi:hypothetical protein
MRKILMLLGSERVTRFQKFATIGFLLAVSLTHPLLGQTRSSSLDKKTTPRALAVIQQLPKGGVRLFPVSIFLDGKYYDARFYYAKPVPMALYDETEYIALTDGMPSGVFTVHTAKQVPDTSIWWGEGDWKPGATGESSPKPSRKSEAKDRPVLHNPKETPDDKTSGDKRTDTATKGNEPPKADDDPDRPVLRKPKDGKSEPQVKISASEMVPKMPADDPDRPMLSRKPTVKKIEEPMPITAPKTGIPGAKYVVAISDPDTMNNRPYDYTWSAEDRKKWTEQVTKLGLEAARKYAAENPRLQFSPTAKFAETSLRATDLDYSNAPYIVFTGRIDPTIASPTVTKTKASAQAAGPPVMATIYVTLVARVNYQGELNRLLTVAADSTHLDLNPRLDLIDAVDADGDNRAELLFRKTTDTGASYVIYRMTPFQMTQVFEGGSGN